MLEWPSTLASFIMSLQAFYKNGSKQVPRVVRKYFGWGHIDVFA